MSINLNEFSKDQLQWMLNKATIDICEISSWRETVVKLDIRSMMNDIWKQKARQEKDLQEIIVQVLNAMGDIAIKEQVVSN